MNDDNLRQYIKKYKNGELTEQENLELQRKLDDFCAFLELADERTFMDTQELPKATELEINNIDKKIRKKINFKLLYSSAVSVIVILFIIFILYIGLSRSMDSLFNPDKNEYISNGSQNYDNSQKIWRATAAIKDLTSPFGYLSGGTGQSKGFGRWNFDFLYYDYLGKTTLSDRTQFEVKYSLGKPRQIIMPNNVFREFYQSALYLSAPTEKYYYPHHEHYGFNDLEKVPKGTVARAIVCFNKRMSFDEYKKFSQGTGIRYTFIDTGFPEPQDKSEHKSFSSEEVKGRMLMGKPTDFSPWHNDQNVIDMATAAKSDTPEFEKKQFIALIKYMQKYDSIAKLIYPDYTFDYDQIIKYIEDNGVYYIGAVVEGDSKELLKLKNNPYVHCITIDKIVVW